MLALFGGRQAVQPDVLLLACPRRVVEGIACTRACRHDPPRCGDRSPWLRRQRQATLVEAALVMQDVLRDISEVDVQVATAPSRRCAFVGIRIHEPELHVLDVRCLEVRLVDLAHDARPAPTDIADLPVGCEARRIEVVRAKLLGIEAEREGGDVAR